MEDVLKTINYKGCQIKIYQDFDCQSPDEWGNNALFLTGWHQREFWVNRDGFMPEDLEDADRQKEIKKDFYVFMLDAYIHSGVALSLTTEGMQCPWDTSHNIGAIFVKKSEAKTRKEAEKLARGLLENWNDALSGNVYGFVTEDKNSEIIDSCWGFYGDPEKSGLIDEAKSSIDYFVKSTKPFTVNVDIEVLAKDPADAKDKASNLLGGKIKKFWVGEVTKV